MKLRNNEQLLFFMFTIALFKYIYIYMYMLAVKSPPLPALGPPRTILRRLST